MRDHQSLLLNFKHITVAFLLIFLPGLFALGDGPFACGKKRNQVTGNSNHARVAGQWEAPEYWTAIDGQSSVIRPPSRSVEDMDGIRRARKVTAWMVCGRFRISSAPFTRRPAILPFSTITGDT